MIANLRRDVVDRADERATKELQQSTGRGLRLVAVILARECVAHADALRDIDVGVGEDTVEHRVDKAALHRVRARPLHHFCLDFFREVVVIIAARTDKGRGYCVDESAKRHRADCAGEQEIRNKETCALLIVLRMDYVIPEELELHDRVFLELEELLRQDRTGTHRTRRRRRRVIEVRIVVHVFRVLDSLTGNLALVLRLHPLLLHPLIVSAEDGRLAHERVRFGERYHREVKALLRLAEALPCASVVASLRIAARVGCEVDLIHDARFLDDTAVKVAWLECPLEPHVRISIAVQPCADVDELHEVDCRRCKVTEAELRDRIEPADRAGQCKRRTAFKRIIKTRTKERDVCNNLIQLIFDIAGNSVHIVDEVLDVACRIALRFRVEVAEEALVEADSLRFEVLHCDIAGRCIEVMRECPLHIFVKTLRALAVLCIAEEAVTPFLCDAYAVVQERVSFRQSHLRVLRDLHHHLHIVLVADDHVVVVLVVLEAVRTDDELAFRVRLCILVCKVSGFLE